MMKKISIQKSDEALHIASFPLSPLCHVYKLAAGFNSLGLCSRKQHTTCTFHSEVHENTEPIPQSNWNFALPPACGNEGICDCLRNIVLLRAIGDSIYSIHTLLVCIYFELIPN